MTEGAGLSGTIRCNAPTSTARPGPLTGNGTMHSTHPSGAMMRRLFALTLAALGLGMALVCRLSASFRRQVTREVTIQIGSADGVFHHYVFAPRTVASHAGAAPAPTLDLCFDNARLGFVTLVSPHAVGRIVHALLARTAEYQGNAVLVLWFYGLTRLVLPIGRSGRLRRPLPDAYITPHMAGPVAARIVHEPPAPELDPAWHAAHSQRAKMVMLRGSAGQPVAMW